MKKLTVTIEQLLAAMERSNYTVFKGEMNLNIIGVRNNNTRSNTFNDLMCVLYEKNGQWQLEQFKCTTDPGTYYRKNPINVDGTAIVVPMQHKSLWTFGYHQGKYKALVQNKPITVFRDGNKDETLNTDVTLSPELKTQKGYFGINCHRANKTTESTQVDKWSAGCQVLANPSDYNQFINLCEQSAATFGKTFTYTLLTQQQLIESE